MPIKIFVQILQVIFFGKPLLYTHGKCLISKLNEIEITPNTCDLPFPSN